MNNQFNKISIATAALSLVVAASIVINSPKPEIEDDLYFDNVKEKTVQVAPVVKENLTTDTTPATPKYNYTQTLTKSMGVYYYNGKKETYYSSRVTYHYMTPQWEIDQNGFYHDHNGYFVVSSSEYPKGTVINISMGKAIVLDCGCAPGVIDIYVNW